MSECESPESSEIDQQQPSAARKANPPRQRSLGDCLLLTALVVAPLIAISQFTAHVWIEYVDDQMFSYFGWRIAQGAVMYVDLWDNKPPGIYYLNALGMWLGGGGYYGVIALCVAAMIGMHALFFAICATVYDRGTAVVGTMLAAIYLTHAYFEAGTNRTETFLMTLELAAVLIYLRASSRDAWWKWLVAGVCCGGAFMFKQIGLAALGAMACHTVYLAAARHIRLRQLIKRGLLLVCGAALAVAAVAGIVVANGGLTALREAYFATITFNRSYFAVGDSSLGYNVVTWTLTWQNAFPVLQLPALMVVAALLHAGLGWRGRRRRGEAPAKTRHPGYLLLFTAWLLIAIYGALVCPQKYRWYLLPILPPMLLIATHLIHRIRAEMGLLERIGRSAWAAAVVVCMAYFVAPAAQVQWRQFWKVWLFRFPEKPKYADNWRSQREWEVVGEAVKEYTEPGDLIQCWGWMPGVYMVADRPNACRFATTEKIGQVGNFADIVVDEVADTLESKRAAALVIHHTDYEWACGRPVAKRAPPKRLHGEIIERNYERVREIPEFNVYIYKRKPDAVGRAE